MPASVLRDGRILFEAGYPLGFKCGLLKSTQSMPMAAAWSPTDAITVPVRDTQPLNTSSGDFSVRIESWACLDSLPHMPRNFHFPLPQASMQKTSLRTTIPRLSFFMASYREG